MLFSEFMNELRQAKSDLMEHNTLDVVNIQSPIIAGAAVHASLIAPNQVSVQGTLERYAMLNQPTEPNQPTESFQTMSM